MPTENEEPCEKCGEVHAHGLSDLLGYVASDVQSKISFFLNTCVNLHASAHDQGEDEIQKEVKMNGQKIVDFIAGLGVQGPMLLMSLLSVAGWKINGLIEAITEHKEEHEKPSHENMH